MECFSFDQGESCMMKIPILALVTSQKLTEMAFWAALYGQILPLPVVAIQKLLQIVFQKSSYEEIPLLAVVPY